MKIFIPLLLFLLLPSLLAINSACSTNANCPNNSACIGSYCQCNSLYILDCSILANYLTSTPTAVILTNTTSYYQTQG